MLGLDCRDAKLHKGSDLTVSQVRAAHDLHLTEKVAREIGLLKR